MFLPHFKILVPTLFFYLLRVSSIAHLLLIYPLDLCGLFDIHPYSWYDVIPAPRPLARAWLLKRGEMGEEYESVSLSGLVERGVLFSPEVGPLLAIARVSSAPASGMPAWTSSQPQPPLS